MEIYQHCSFCEHKKFDFTTGNLCGITNKKADFIRKCPKIELNINAKNEIARINKEYKKIQDQKVDVFGHLVMFSIIGVVIMVADIFLTQYLYDTGWVSTISIIGIGIGMSAIVYAFAPFYKYREANSVAKDKKKELDNFLALYDYDYEINFEKENPEAAVKLFRSKRSA
ncbi:hypothetical protein C8N46_104277 [Kordia periserrulae]|uniref:Uncharacterized protein n=1 Tax=Kordia periserrulae TaxID=701523 RepID=A0A2T6BZY4_9FLAO|nr:hypothetical protein [Kordia periserrulae]PTX61634.1 hypothetical protein C8N46_104277 [Kordia periserrulae]